MFGNKYLFILFLILFSNLSPANSCLDQFKNNKFTSSELKEIFDAKIFKGNDIRGVFEKDFHLDFSKLLGKALMSFSENQLSVSKPKILIGYDARLSGPQLTKILSETLLKQGSTVSVVGLIPTPLAYFLLHHYDYTAAVIVTASHNPVGHNGFKIMFNNKYERYNVIPDLKSIVENQEFLEGERSLGQKVKLDSYTPYINSLKKEFPNLKPISFVVDAGNGSAGPLSKKVFKDLDLKPHYLFMEPDGTFPNHHPDPTKESNLQDLKKKIAENNSVFGVGFDGDGDRLGIITSQNRIIHSDEFGYMFLPSLLSDPEISKTLIADVKVSNWYYEKAKKMGADVIMSKAGYSFLRENMERNQASLAMEFSGHIMFNDRPDRGFDDALYNLLRFIELIGDNKGDIESLLPEVHTVKTNEIRLKLDLETINKAIDNLKIYLNKSKESYVDIDGVRITRGESWGLVRDSKTEQVLSLRFEALSKQDVLDLIEEFSKVMEIEISEKDIVLY